MHSNSDPALCDMQVYMRKGRLLLSLQAVKHALKLAGPAHPDVHRLIVRFCKAVQQQQQQHSSDQVTCCICTKLSDQQSGTAYISTCTSV